MKTYKVGESVVHLSHGVGVVSGLEEAGVHEGKETAVLRHPNR